jgi:hypothetical protein
MDGRTLTSINTSLSALIRQLRERGDQRPVAVLVDEMLAASGFGELDARAQVTSLRRRAATARRTRVPPVPHARST